MASGLSQRVVGEVDPDDPLFRSGLNDLRNELPVVTANIQDPSAWPLGQQFSQPRRPGDVEA